MKLFILQATGLMCLHLDFALLHLGVGRRPYRSSWTQILTCEHDVSSSLNFCTFDFNACRIQPVRNR